MSFELTSECLCSSGSSFAKTSDDPSLHRHKDIAPMFGLDRKKIQKSSALSTVPPNRVARFTHHSSGELMFKHAMAGLAAATALSGGFVALGAATTTATAGAASVDFSTSCGHSWGCGCRFRCGGWGGGWGRGGQGRQRVKIHLHIHNNNTNDNDNEAESRSVAVAENEENDD
ncbi:hypothetical protein [Nonomuraea sp. NPDC005501]|uniref:hypothetical protein n=1 Tax=Nonomuraea sp. NPDC005501 TaxID=3156884 RepID=UPI0033A07807